MSAKVVKVSVDHYQCQRCGHLWIPRTDDPPAVCPKCKSPFWDRPRRWSNKKRVA